MSFLVGNIFFFRSIFFDDPGDIHFLSFCISNQTPYVGQLSRQPSAALVLPFAWISRASFFLPLIEERKACLDLSNGMFRTFLSHYSLVSWADLFPKWTKINNCETENQWEQNVLSKNSTSSAAHRYMVKSNFSFAILSETFFSMFQVSSYFWLIA